MMLRTKRSIFPQSDAPMNSDSVDDMATVGWSFDLYATVPPARRRHIPVIERRVLGQVAHSASTYACRSDGE